MKFAIAILAAFTLSAQATIVTKFAKIYPPDEDFKNYEVLAFYDGRVFEVSPDSPDILETIQYAKDFQLPVEIQLEEQPMFASNEAPELIVEARIAASELQGDQSHWQSFDPPESLNSEPFQPSELDDMDQATDMFSSLYPRTRRKTECFNRAHIWNRQMHKDFGVNSEKIFIFYTRKYRRAYRRWKWWFHTAPLIRVQGETIVLDREYTSNPITELSWEWQFSAPNREDESHRCSRIEQMSEYYDRFNTNNIFCNTLIAPMYYWEPSELSKRDRQGQIKNQWVNWELRLAARDMFGRWLDVYNELKVD